MTSDDTSPAQGLTSIAGVIPITPFAGIRSAPTPPPSPTESNDLREAADRHILEAELEAARERLVAERGALELAVADVESLKADLKVRAATIQALDVRLRRTLDALLSLWGQAIAFGEVPLDVIRDEVVHLLDGRQHTVDREQLARMIGGSE
jgi:hypothetical protein